MEKIEEIKKLKSLLDQGAISEEEFKILKDRLISSDEVSVIPEKKVSASAPKVSQSEKKVVKKPSAKKKAKNVGFEAANEFTLNLFKIGLALSALTGIIFWIRYENITALIIVAVLGIGLILAIPRTIPRLLHRNLLLALVNIGLLLLIIYPIGNTSSFSFKSVDLNNVTEVKEDMQGTWIGNSHDGIGEFQYIHYKVEVSGNYFKGWMEVARTSDEPQWSSKPDVSGDYNLSEVLAYTNTTNRYRNIYFKEDDRNDLLSARSLTRTIVYDGGLYVASWGRMRKK